ncbi:aminotransferase class I/II-fold pyridoxal phosphate-dependent enzyme [Dehalococcoidia bacterium]|nr:aminotransferase class I/II-fold pyridoxal phosphate-dependent enzyme [Dehalococcoidia bacterium]
MKKIARTRISERASLLPPSGIRKFFDLIVGMENVISLGVGEPDFATPWRIREAAIHAVERGHTHYTSNYGLLSLREKLGDSLASRYGVSYNPSSQLLITVGVSQGLDLAMRALLNPGDEVLIPEPTYVSYMPCVSLAGGVPVPVPTSSATSFSLKASDIKPYLTARSRALLIGYPNNPTGAVLNREELDGIVALAKSHDLTVVSDEVYDRLTYDQHQHLCFSSLDGAEERTILLGGFSKDYAMTGWRVGYAAGPPELIEAMMKVHQYTMMCAPTMSQMAALEALMSGDGEVEAMLSEYDHRRRIMVKGLNEIGLPCFMPRGAFYAFPSIKATGMSSEEFAERLLSEERVAVVPGSAFGNSGEGHVRCCYAVSLTEIEEALLRMGRFTKKHG